MRVRLPALVTVVLLLALAACGGGAPSPTGLGGELDPASARQGEAEDGGTQEDRSEGPASSSERGEAEGSPSDTEHAFDAGADPDDPFLLELTLSADCAVRGDTMTAHVRTEPEVMIGFTAYYLSNTSYVPDIHFVPTHVNATGEYSWTWTLRPDTPIGDAAVEVVAGARGRGGTAKEPFEVARRC